MSSRRLPLSLVVLPTEVNIDITGHLVATLDWAMDDLRSLRWPTERCFACAITRPLVGVWRYSDLPSRCSGTTTRAMMPCSTAWPA
jgi:hypothetical protein